MTAKIQIRRDTTVNWTAPTPPTLAEGEIGLDTTLKAIKIGDNVNNWTALPWLKPIFDTATPFTAGTAALPSITTTGDLNTGIAFTAADTVVVATAGLAAITVGPSQGVTLSANLSVAGTLDMTSGLINNVLTPVSANDAATKSYVDGTRIGQTAIISVDATTVGTEVSGTTITSLFTCTVSGITNLRSAAGTWRGIACSSTGNYAQLNVNTTAASTTAVNGGTAPTTTFWATLIRTA